jgi:hypothetical protein
MKGQDMTAKTTEVIECVPFDGMGKIVAPDAAIFAKLKKHEPEKFERLSAMLKANLEADDTEAARYKMEQDLFAAVKEAQRLHLVFQNLTPPPTRIDEVRRVSAARAGRPLPPIEPHPKAEAAAIEADDAEAVCVKMRADLYALTVDLKIKRRTLAEKIMAWQGVQPRRDTAFLVRENIKAEEARRQERIAQGLPLTDPVPEPYFAEPIDRVMYGGRGNANVSWKRQPGMWRGAPNAPTRKLPSER